MYQLNIYKNFFKSKCNKTMTKELNLKIQNYNLISIKVNRPTTMHLRFQRKLTSYTLFLFSVKINFVSFLLTLPMLQKTFSLVKERGQYGLFCVRGFMFGNRFVKIFSNFEIKLFCHCLVAFGLENIFFRSLVRTPITF